MQQAPLSSLEMDNIKKKNNILGGFGKIDQKLFRVRNTLGVFAFASLPVIDFSPLGSNSQACI